MKRIESSRKCVFGRAGGRDKGFAEKESDHVFDLDSFDNLETLRCYMIDIPKRSRSISGKGFRSELEFG
jgi:hypothetical protein